MISRSDSESSASPRFVEPLRSEKTIVTVLRTSCGGSAGASGVPQNPHSLNRSGFSSPQAGHVAIGRVYARFAGILRRRDALRAVPAGSGPVARGAGTENGYGSREVGTEGT